MFSEQTVLMDSTSQVRMLSVCPVAPLTSSHRPATCAWQTGKLGIVLLRRPSEELATSAGCSSPHSGPAGTGSRSAWTLDVSPQRKWSKTYKVGMFLLKIFTHLAECIVCLTCHDAKGKLADECDGHTAYTRAAK